MAQIHYDVVLLCWIRGHRTWTACISVTIDTQMTYVISAFEISQLNVAMSFTR